MLECECDFDKGSNLGNEETAKHRIHLIEPAAVYFGISEIGFQELSSFYLCLFLSSSASTNL